MTRKRRKKKSGSLLSALLLGLLFGVVLVIVQELIYQQGLMKEYESGSADHQVVSSPVSPLPSASAPQEGDGQEDGETQSDAPPGYTYMEEDNQVQIQLGDGHLVLDFQGLKAQNEDFVGWFVVPGTDISYPVVQGTDNSFYLTHIFESQAYGKLGALFVDYRNTMLSDENTIIYGHNFHQYGAMFSKLVYYAEQAYYDGHPTMYFLTEDGGYLLEVFSAYEAATTDPAYTLTFATNDDFGRFLTDVCSSSAIVTDVAVTVEDKVVTLSTCSNTDSDGRFVVVCRAQAFH